MSRRRGVARAYPVDREGPRFACPLPKPRVFDACQRMFDFPARAARHDAQDERVAQDPNTDTAESREAEFIAPVLETPTRAIRGMVRETDGIEAQRAAVDVKEHASQLQRRLYDILRNEGPRTARALEQRDEFKPFRPSTVRKRLSELKAKGKIEQVGREDRMAIWGAVE